MPMLSMLCFFLDLHAYVQIYEFMCFVPYLCAQIYTLVTMPCASIALLLVDASLSCVLALFGGVQIQIPWTKPISKGLDHFLYTCLCLLACFYSLCLCLPVQIQALPCFAPSVGLCLSILGATCFVWLHLALLRSVWMQPLVRYTFVVLVCLVHTFLHSM